MSDNQVVFTIYELNMIFKDQKEMLESIHYGMEMCYALHNCPLDHFDNEEVERVIICQEIMKKILSDANKE